MPAPLSTLPWPVVVVCVVAALLALAVIRGPRRASPGLAERWSVDVLRHVPGWQVLPGPDGSGLDRVVVSPAAVLAVVVCGVDTAETRLAAITGADQLRRTLRAGRERAAGPVPTAGPVLAVLAVTDLDAAPEGGHMITDAVHVVDGIRPERWLAQFGRADLRRRPSPRVAAADADGYFRASFTT